MGIQVWDAGHFDEETKSLGHVTLQNGKICLTQRYTVLVPLQSGGPRLSPIAGESGGEVAALHLRKNGAAEEVG